MKDLECERELIHAPGNKSQYEKRTLKKSLLGILRPIVIILILMLNCQSVHAAELSLQLNSSVGATGYRVYYGFEGRNYIFEVDIGLWTQCTIPGLDPGQTYYFAVTAYNDYGESDFSMEISYAPKLCEADFDVDGDIDGSDLVKIVTDPSPTTLRDFAAKFGTASCDN